MSNTFNFGTPSKFDKQTINNTVVELDKTTHNFAVVQFQDNAGAYVATPGNIARYRRDGVDPTTTDGFYAGDGDQVVFSNAELRSGVKILNSVGGQPMDIVVQYYRNV